MKKVTLILSITLFFIANISAQSKNVKYQIIENKTFKFTFYDNQKLESKELVILSDESSGEKYKSLDFYEEYDEKGNLTFKGNKINGRHLEYYTTGEKMIQGAVKDSKKEGRWVYYDKTNTITKVEVYNSNEIIKTVNY